MTGNDRKIQNSWVMEQSFQTSRPCPWSPDNKGGREYALAAFQGFFAGSHWAATSVGMLYVRALMRSTISAILSGAPTSSGSTTSSITGGCMVNCAYSPNSVSTTMSPPARRATSAAMGSPSPAPSAPSRVDEEGIEYPVDILPGDTGAVVPNPHLDHLFNQMARYREPRLVLLPKLGSLGLHGKTGVGYQVDYRLAEIPLGQHLLSHRFIQIEFQLHMEVIELRLERLGALLRCSTQHRVQVGQGPASLHRRSAHACAPRWPAPCRRCRKRDRGSPLSRR